ncbi:MAG TPA: 4-hydroxybenzoate octaprenyltransferase [Parvularcula sp.]|nr:4-hydroxybenzoate octaprenyltransferase [Parvularcula sp.]
MTAAPADADSGNWVDRHAPEALRPYLRLMRADRPIGTWLLLIPCWQGLALGAIVAPPTPLTALWQAALFAAGAVVMRGAGCAYNDIADRDFDAKVARTALRPIPAGQISVRQAWTFLIALSLIGLAALLQFNRATILLGVASLALVAVYPFMKRITWWPQAWLGLTFNWGALMGYSSVTGEIGAPALLLYASGVAWTLGYDTIYAHQDKEDDALIGVKSSARRLGAKTKPALTGFYAGSLVLAALAYLLGGAVPAGLVLFVIPAAHLRWQIKAADIDDPVSCLAVFRSNRDAGLLVLAPFLLAAVLARA